MDDLSRRYGRDRVFNDFLTMAICALSMQQQEELYFKTIKPYRKEELNIFSEAFAALVIEMDNKKGFKDVLGDYFEEYFYNEKLGQFFTPFCLCQLMAELVPPTGPNMYDPCCGSGRIFLAVGEKNRDLIFYGGDISETCCKMTLINMCLNNLQCRIAWMNSLSMEIYKEWAVVRQKYTNLPFIIEINEKSEIKEITEIEDITTKEVQPLKFKRFSKIA